MTAVLDILENDKLDTIDGIEAAALENFPLVECKTEHFFAPDTYIRKCTMPQGSLVVSKIHKQKHPFWITRGHVSIWTENEGWQHITAPFCGITEPGTRRILLNHEETVFVTFQNTQLTDPDEIEAELIEPHVNPLIPIEVQEAVQKLCRGDVRSLEAR
jgi:hypothetical protein